VIWLRSWTCRSPGDVELNVDRPRIHFVSAHKAGAGAGAGVAASAQPGDCRAYHRQQHINTSAFRRAASFQPYHGRRRQDTGSSSGSRFPMSSKRSVVKMTMLVVVGFVVCWTPYFVVSLVRIYSGYDIELDEVLSISEIMALGHSAVNPLLYMIYSRRAVRTFCWQVRRRVRCLACHCATASRPNNCPSPPPQPPALPFDVHVTGNKPENGEEDRTRRNLIVAGGGDDGGHVGGARSAPCHVTCSWSWSFRREASAATDSRPYRRHAVHLRGNDIDDQLVPVTCLRH